jgi:hypothetical protein
MPRLTLIDFAGAFDVTPYAVDRLRNRGYQLVAVDTCMGES